MLRRGLGMVQGSQVFVLERSKEEEEGGAKPDTIQNPGGWRWAKGRPGSGQESVGLKNTSERLLAHTLCWEKKV